MTSPVVLVALAVLVLNDHVLKHAWPGAVTGTLSDVAGPVVAAALLGALARAAIRAPGRAIGRPSRVTSLAEPLAWWAVAAAFALAKTVPAVNAAVPIAGVRDPYDVLGLLALPLAWRLTRRPAPRAFRALPRMAVTVAAVLAVSATSQSPRLSVLRIDGSGGTIRAYGEDTSADEPAVWASTDGLSWRAVGRSPTLPEPRTSTCSGRHCYRIASVSVIEESTDGGATWHASWTSPERDDLGELRDITFVAGTEIVIVARERRGVLWRQESLAWREAEVGDAYPLAEES